MNLFDFMLNTREGLCRKHKNGNVVFINYLTGSYKESKGQIIRNNDDKVVPEMFGWPPLLHRYEDEELYEGCILLLFNPWRDIRQLKNGHESFGRAFVHFEEVMSREIRDRIDHIQSYHKCGWGGVDRVFEGDNWFHDL